MHQGNTHSCSNDRGEPCRWNGTGGSPGSEGSRDLRNGIQGIVVVMYPICNVDLSSCTEYAVDGGANGGNITFVPCGTSSLETITLDPLDKISICAYQITNPTAYPSASGDVTFVSTGSCSSYTEPPNPDSCPTGSTLSPLYNTEVDVTAPAVGPYPGQVCLSWDDYLGNRQSQCVGTGTHYYCAQSGSLTVDTLTVGATYTITHTAVQCGYYCSGSV